MLYVDRVDSATEVRSSSCSCAGTASDLGCGVYPIHIQHWCEQVLRFLPPQPLPAKKETLVFFTVPLSRSMAPSSIQVYIAAVGNLHRQMGYRVPMHSSETLGLEWVLWCKREEIVFWRGHLLSHLFCQEEASSQHSRNNVRSRLITRGPVAVLISFPPCLHYGKVDTVYLPLHPKMSPCKRCCHHSKEFLPLD